MHRAMNSRQRRQIILSQLMDGNKSTNDIIDDFYTENCRRFMRWDNRKQRQFLREENDPNVYTHINKEPTYLKKEGYVREVGTQIGKKGVEETILSITPAGRRALRVIYS